MIKPFLGAVDVSIDRARQIITLKKDDGQVETLTVDQLFDEIESMFPRRRRPESVVGRRTTVTLDPLGAGTLDRIDSAWLSDYDKPVSNPLSQAV